MVHTFLTRPVEAGECVDVAIVGAGVVGCAIARVLSRYQISAVVVDGGEDVSMGASRANSAIVHAGYDGVPGTHMARMNVEGNRMMTQWCEELDVPLSRPGSMVIAFDGEDEKVVRELYARGLENKVPGLSIITGEEARRLEPRLSEKVICALYAQTGGITIPFELAIASAENARENGVRFMLGAKVTCIQKEENALVLTVGDQTLRARYVVNAAGLYADDIARLIGDDSFSISPRKGEYILMDKRASGIQRIIFQVPSAMGKGVLVAPTADGNAFAGPTAVNTQDKEDTSVSREGIDTLKKMAARSVPDLAFYAAITTFSGVRAIPSVGDFVLRPSAADGRMVHAAGICSPGLTSAPAIAEYIADVLKQQGLALEAKEGYQPLRRSIPAFAEMGQEERLSAIEKDRRFAQIVCRCETVTEAEIVEAISRGAYSLDAVKRRTRAGMGRCQGGFCSPRVMELISKQANIPMEELTKFGGDSYLLAGKRGEVHCDA